MSLYGDIIPSEMMENPEPPDSELQKAIALIEANDGYVIWRTEPKEPAEPAVCTCESHSRFWYRRPDDKTWDDIGPWHEDSCALHVPF